MAVSTLLCGSALGGLGCSGGGMGWLIGFLPLPFASLSVAIWLALWSARHRVAVVAVARQFPLSSFRSSVASLRAVRLHSVALRIRRVHQVP